MCTSVLLNFDLFLLQPPPPWQLFAPHMPPPPKYVFYSCVISQLRSLGCLPGLCVLLSALPVACWSQVLRALQADCAYYFPAPALPAFVCPLKTGHGVSIYITEIGKWYKAGLFKRHWLANMYQHNTVPLLCFRNPIIHSMNVYSFTWYNMSDIILVAGWANIFPGIMELMVLKGENGLIQIFT